MANAEPIAQLIAGATEQGIIRALAGADQVGRQGGLGRGQAPNVHVVNLRHTRQSSQGASGRRHSIVAAVFKSLEGAVLRFRMAGTAALLAGGLGMGFAMLSPGADAGPACTRSWLPRPALARVEKIGVADAVEEFAAYPVHDAECHRGSVVCRIDVDA